MDRRYATLCQANTGGCPTIQKKKKKASANDGLEAEWERYNI
jgi:hypothetical protein